MIYCTCPPCLNCLWVLGAVTTTSAPLFFVTLPMSWPVVANIHAGVGFLLSLHLRGSWRRLCGSQSFWPKGSQPIRSGSISSVSETPQRRSHPASSSTSASSVRSVVDKDQTRRRGGTLNWGMNEAGPKGIKGAATGWVPHWGAK